MSNVGYATLQVIPSMRGVQARMTRAMGGAGAAAGSQAGRGFTSSLGAAARRVTSVVADTIKRGVQIAGAGAAALLGTSLVKGFRRFTAIEDATTALTVQLGSATKAGELLGGVLKVVQGTPFNFDQFASAAQQLVGMGIDAQKVPGYLTAIGEASSTQGRRAGEFAERLSASFGRVAAQGRVMGGDINDISATGVNALAILANHFEVNTGAMRKMISDGAVPADEALDALAKGILEGSDGMAGATVAFEGTMAGLRKTLSGSIGGFGAALARFGAAVIAPFSGRITKAFTGAADLLDRVSGRAADLAVVAVDKTAVGIRAVVDGFKSGKSPGEGFAGIMGNVGVALSDAWDFARKFVEAVRTGDGPVGEWKDALLLLGGPLTMVTRDLLPALVPLLDAVSEVLAEVANDVGPPLIEFFAGLAEATIPVLVDAVEGLTSVVEAHPEVVKIAVAIVAGRWVYLQGVAMVNAVRIALAWGISHAASAVAAAVTVAKVAIMAGRWVWLAGVAMVNAIRIALAWAVSHAPAAASAAVAVAALALTGAKWIWLAGVVTVRAAIIAGAWLIAAGPPGWIIAATAAAAIVIVAYWDQVAAAAGRAASAIERVGRSISDAIPGGGLIERLERLGHIPSGARAAGGPVSAYGSYLVGEKGPEMFRPRSAGTIIPNHALNAVAETDGGRPWRAVHIENLNMPSGDIWAAIDRAELLAPLMP